MQYVWRYLGQYICICCMYVYLGAHVRIWGQPLAPRDPRAGGRCIWDRDDLDCLGTPSAPSSCLLPTINSNNFELMTLAGPATITLILCSRYVYLCARACKYVRACVWFMSDAPALTCLARCNIHFGAKKGQRGSRIERDERGVGGLACQSAYFSLAASPTGRFLTN